MHRRLRTLLAATLLATPWCAWAAAPPPTPKVTRSGELRAPGVRFMLYNDNYSPIFFDQKDAALQIILHGGAWRGSRE